MSFESVILSNLVHNEEYTRKVIPFLKPEYFRDPAELKVFELITGFVDKYNSLPSIEALAIELSNATLSEQTFLSALEIVKGLEKTDTKTEWLVDQSEKFCQERALHGAIMEAITIMDDKTGKLSPGSIPKLLQDALGVSFDSSIGHDFIDDADARYAFYNQVESRLPFDLEFFNKITNGGLPNKTLNVALAGTGVGKSLFMCHCAAAYLMAGKNVLYITLEMSEERIAERIDANLLDVPLDELKSYPKEMYDKKIDRIRKKSAGKVIVKEYPTACAGSANFRHLINELKLKRNFIPDVIIVDYLNICMSSRIKHGANVNSYTLVKAIAEELRGLAVENNVPLITATQTTRSGYSSSDVGLEDTSESFGLPATADFMFALINTEELAELNQIMVKQLKNRYNDAGFNRRFVIGVDRSKMRLYDVEQAAQDDIIDPDGGRDRPVMDKGKFMTEDMERQMPNKFKFDKKKFADFK